MFTVKRVLLILLLIIAFVSRSYSFFLPSSGTGANVVKKAPRWNLPWIGIGQWCNGCPPLGCDDDEAIIHGYCCGCAYGLDKLPVQCQEFLQCPLNLHGLCHDYEYMMRCCC